MAILALPISVSAGAMGDFFNNIFGGAGKTDQLSDKNVQNMALLVAATTPLSEGSSVPTVESNALVASEGPSGGTVGSVNLKPASDQISVYVVREGDTLSQIAKMYDVSVNTIKWSNDLSSNVVKPGDTLVILPVSGVKHTVTKGDTLASIAKKYKADIDEIAEYNGLSKSDSLALGSVVIVPDGEISISSPSYVAPDSSSLASYSGYYIKPLAKYVKTQGIHGYNAIDLAAPAGTPIRAAASGEVIVSRIGGWNGGYGNYIVIKHSNGTQTLYSHNSANFVSVGD